NVFPPEMPGGFGGGGGGYYQNGGYGGGQGGFGGGAGQENSPTGDNGGGGAGFGGAVFNHLGTVLAVETNFTANAAQGGGGGGTADGFGGALFNLNGTVRLAHIAYTGNTAQKTGGATDLGTAVYNLSHNAGNTAANQTPTATLYDYDQQLTTANGELDNNQVNGTAKVVSAAAAVGLISPASIAFGSVINGQTAATQTITVTNAGTAPMTVLVNQTGTNAFVIKSYNCPNSLGAGASCQIYVYFAPLTTGSYSGQIVVATNGTPASLATNLTAAGIPPPYPPAATPKISPGTGTYVGSVKVSITDTTPGATIYYTTDYTMPTTSSPKYTGPFTVSGNDVVRAIATAPNYWQSAVATASYAIIYAPSVTTTGVGSITSSGATLGGIVLPNGQNGYAWFTWGTSQGNLNHQTPYTSFSGTGRAFDPISAKLSGLTTKTTYYFRAWAETAGGVVSGGILSFKTK
ncbi:MAG: choice-of-anchor D domain-containing protein, partial [Terracidiphilus sp.]